VEAALWERKNAAYYTVKLNAVYRMRIYSNHKESMTMTTSIPKVTLGLAGMLAAASELCKRGIRTQLTHGNRISIALLINLMRTVRSVFM
jgi:hypothetical protein